MDERALPDEIVTSLWLEGPHCGGRHYLIGNPHTFPGRMAAWCETSAQEIAISKAEVENASAEALAWIDSFLAGSEPTPPDGDGSEAEQQWDEERRAFRSTGEGPAA